MSAMAWRIAGCALLLGLVLGGYGQAWRYGRLLAEQEQRLVQQRLDQAEALHGLLLTEREQRQGLERRLKDTTQLHWKELTDAQQAQARLRDRLATADLRLSVLLDTTDQCGGCGCQPPPAPEAWFMEPYAPTLTERMLKELSPSPEKVTED